MSIKGYRQASKIDWGYEESEGINLAQINAGAMLRIADATEKMAQRHTELIRDRDYWERRAKAAEQALDTERHRTASLRGHLKRAKKMMPNGEVRGASVTAQPACEASSREAATSTVVLGHKENA